MTRNRGRAGAILFAVGMAQAGACAAADVRSALKDADYQLSWGDVNGDGLPDLLAVGKPKIISLSLDEDMPAIPIRIPALAKNFALVSATGGAYSLTANPSQSMIDAAYNKSAAKPSFGDVTGGGYLSMFVPSIAAGMPSFVVGIGADGSLQLRQRVTQDLVGIDLNAADVTTALSDMNGDGRADLVISKGGRVSFVLYTDANGNLYKEAETETKTAEVVLNQAFSAMKVGDKAGVLAYFSPQSRAEYDTLFTAAGADMAAIPGSITSFRMRYVFNGTAEAVLTANLNGRVTMHFVTLIMGPNGWEIRDL